MRPEISSTYKIGADTRHRKVGREGIVLRQREGEVVVVNEIAARVLDYIGEGLDVAGMVEALHREYDVDQETLASDIASYLGELEQMGAIEPL